MKMLFYLHPVDRPFMLYDGDGLSTQDMDDLRAFLEEKSAQNRGMSENG